MPKTIRLQNRTGSVNSIKKPPYGGFFNRCFYYYRNPLARQHADAADFQSEYCFAGLRKSRHGCHVLQRLSVPLPVHFAQRRSVHVWFETPPVSVVHFTTTFWFLASFRPSSLDDITWYALAPYMAIIEMINVDNIFFICAP